MKKKTGFSRKMYQCPDCLQVMKKNTLKRKTTPEEWGKWLYASIRCFSNPREKFYDRISWDKLSFRIKSYGFANDFWNGFKEAKTYSETELETIAEKVYIPEKTQLKL